MSKARMWQMLAIALVLAFGMVTTGDFVPSAYAQVEVDPGDGKEGGMGDPDVPSGVKDVTTSQGSLDVEPYNGRHQIGVTPDPHSQQISRGVSYGDYKLWVRMLSMLMRVGIGWF